MSDKDLVIVGGGPAGLTASIYAQRALLDAVLVEQEAIGGQVVLTNEIDNYPGVPHTDGFTLSDLMQKQALDLGAKISMSDINSIKKLPDGRFSVRSADETYNAKAIILATGATPRQAGFIGEKDYAGRGISYCATCDGMFYRNKQVFVIGGGNSACEEALFLTRFANSVTIVVRKDHLRAQASIAKKLKENPKILIRYLTSIVKVEGDKLLRTVTFRDNASGKETTETYEEGSFGVFVFVGRVPATDLVKNFVKLDERGYVITNDRMETNVAGLFAAGDVRQKPLRQIVTATADGACAANSVAAYLGQPVEG
ncbi:MAG: thioredoxin-disulfide reductase [Olegusella sp.]|jgi:thioredoxin reductase (NADPH)|nr:thioredoxin-disulfide reductase [Olegusella sp.]